MDTGEFLNGVYEPLFHRVQSIGRRLAIEGYAAKWSWYNLHASQRGDEYKVDTHLSNEQARAFRWNRLIWPFELYGVENYTEDLYVPGMSRSELPERIAKYGGEIGIAFSMPWESKDEEIVEIVNACREWGTHMTR